jgi:hypothetical protein
MIIHPKYKALHVGNNLQKTPQHPKQSPVTVPGLSFEPPPAIPHPLPSHPHHWLSIAQQCRCTPTDMPPSVPLSGPKPNPICKKEHTKHPKTLYKRGWQNRYTAYGMQTCAHVNNSTTHCVHPPRSKKINPKALRCTQAVTRVKRAETQIESQSSPVQQLPTSKPRTPYARQVYTCVLLVSRGGAFELGLVQIYTRT